MTLPRYYQIALRDAQGTPRALAVDLDRRALGEPAELVRTLASTVRSMDAAMRGRTSYVEVPAAEAEAQPLLAYAWGDGTPNATRFRRHLEALYQTGALHRFEVRTGSWAEGADLVGRGSVVERLCASLRSGGKVHLMAPRRYGKTSLVRAVEERLVAEERLVVRIDVESVESVVGLLVRLVDEAFQVTEALRAIPDLQRWPARDASTLAIAEACQSLHDHARTAPIPLLSQVCAALARARATVLVDEFTRFVLLAQRRESGRTLSRGLEALAGQSGPSLLVCGSQGLRAFVEWHDLDVLRALDSVPVGPLAREDAATLVEELFYGAGQPPLQEVVNAVLEAVGAPIPYFLHGLVHHTLQEARGRGRAGARPLDRALVERAYERRMLDQEGNEFFRPFRLRERGYPDPLRDPAAAILRELARTSGPIAVGRLRAMGALPDEDFAVLLAALGEDYDLVVEGDAAWLRSKVMRERWARREAWLRGDDA